MLLDNKTPKKSEFPIFEKLHEIQQLAIESHMLISKDAGNYYHMHVDWTELAT